MPTRWMLTWIASPGAELSGFHPPQAQLSGFHTPRAGLSDLDRARIDTEIWLRLWITSSGKPRKGSQEAGFHPPLLRGITHRTIGVSPTESRGFTHQPLSKSRRNARFFGLFFRLNLLNDSYLTESFNPPHAVQGTKGQAELAYGPIRLRCVPAIAVTRAAYGRRLPREAKRDRCVPVRRCT